MRAKKLSRIVGFAFVVAIMGGIGATAWADTDEQAPPPAPAVVESPKPSPAAPSAPVKPKPASRADIVWN